MKIGMYFDPYASMDQTPEEEYQEAKEFFDKLLPGNNVYETGLLPWKLTNNPLDVYVFDVGGMACTPGTGSLVKNHFHALARQIEERPSTLFVIWSAFTTKWYRAVVGEEYPGLLDAPNVLFRYQAIWEDQDESFVAKLSSWFAKP